MADERMNAMRTTLELFTEAKWLQNSLVKDDQVFFTPSIEGLEVAPNLFKLLKLINEDPTGELAACVMWLCETIGSPEFRAFTDDQEIERLDRQNLARERTAEAEGKENRG